MTLKEKSVIRKKKYDTNPNICGWCNKGILSEPGVTLFHTKVKRFCDRTCANKHINKMKGINARKIYNTNPNRCIYCEKPILAEAGKKLFNIKRKIFCNHSCSAKFSNKYSIKRKELALKGKREKEKLMKDATKERAKERLTKELKLFNSTKKEINRQHIGSIAKKVMSNEKKICVKCSYDRHVHVCHIKAVKDFPDTALIKEINHKDNLVYLCPNCHWEFDKGLITL